MPPEKSYLIPLPLSFQATFHKTIKQFKTEAEWTDDSNASASVSELKTNVSQRESSTETQHHSHNIPVVL